MTSEIAGARFESTEVTVEEFDLGYAATAGSALLQQLSADAFGNEFTGLETWSDMTWWLLGRLVAGLRIGPDRRLGDRCSMCSRARRVVRDARSTPGRRAARCAASSSMGSAVATHAHR